MKKVLMILCCIGLCGCHAMGSIEHGTLDFDSLSERIDERIESGEWKMNVLQASMEASLIEDVYGIDEALFEEGMAKTSLISTCDEIVVIHVSEGKAQAVMDALEAYKEARKEIQNPLMSQNSLLEQAEIVQIGQYVLYVCGEDHANVVQYISSLT